MSDLSREELVKMITREVMRLMSEGDCSGNPENPDGYVLVIGDPAGVKDIVEPNLAYVGIEDYETHKDILRYRSVIIERLTLTQLVDISAGRAADHSCAAIVDALLNDGDIRLLESGLPHRKYKGKVKNPFYQKLEQDVKQLQMYGIKLVSKSGIKKESAKFRPGNSRVKAEVITEAKALSMAQGNSGGQIISPSGTNLTPSAKDIFQKANVKVITE